MTDVSPPIEPPALPARPESSIRLTSQTIDADGGRSAVSSQHALNGRLAIGLLAVVFLSPIPFGSHGPAFWTISAAVVGLIGGWFWTRLSRIGAAPRIAARALRIEGALFAVFCCALVVQVLPLGALLPVSFVLPDGSILSSRTLSLAPGDTWLMLLRQAGYGLFFVLVVEAAVNRRRAEWMITAIFTMIALHAIFGLVSLTQWGDTLLGLQKEFYQGFATGTFVNRNSFATFLACGLSLGVALLLGLPGKTEREPWKRVAEAACILIALGFILAALFATGSRMGALAGAAGAVAVLVTGAVARPRRSILWTGLVVWLAGILFLAAFGDDLLSRTLEAIRSLEGRQQLYVEIWEMIAARPLLGYGGGAFAVAFPLFQHPPVDGGLVWGLAHSTYLALWSELGIVFGSLPVLIVMSLGVRIARSLRETANFIPALSAIGAIVACGVHALVDFSLEIQANAYLFAALLAIGAAGLRSATKRSSL